MQIRWNILLPILLMVVFALTRWPGLLPLNFSAAYALAFCGAIYFSGTMAWWMPLTTLFVSDLLMNIFYYKEEPLSRYMLVNYSAFLLIIALGRRFKPQMAWLKIVAGGLVGALLFYIITNTAAWLQNKEYTKDLMGWIQALTVGTPGWPHTWTFFWNTLLSTGLFTGLFAGAMKWEASAESKREKEAGEQSEDEKPAAGEEGEKAETA